MTIVYLVLKKELVSRKENIFVDLFGDRKLAFKRLHELNKKKGFYYYFIKVRFVKKEWKEAGK